VGAIPSAPTLGSTAGSADLTDGMFRHLVVTGQRYRWPAQMAHEVDYGPLLLVTK